MQLDKWNNEYLRIVSTLNLNIEEDIASTYELETFLLSKLSYRANLILEKIVQLMKHPILIAGAGPSLETDLEHCVQHINLDGNVLLAVDGSCSLFQKLQIDPDIVITDLDGEWSAIRWAISRGAITLIHAHGDNRNLIQQFFKEENFQNQSINIWGTTQNSLDTTLFNFGGFTDGDRAIFLSFHFQSPIIGLIGFDFGEEIGEYSTRNLRIKKDRARKREKFKIALSLLDSYKHIHKGDRFNLTFSGEPIPGFPNLSYIDFNHQLVEWNKLHNTLESPIE